tara:strand:- start:58 stop:408 length:351 start_codon:yes stop_codon:yes gene_type:complete
MNFENMSDEDILKIADPIMDNLMDASTEINYEKHVRDFTDRMKAIVTKDYLEKVCKQYQSEKGFFTERDVIAVFKRPDSAAIIWRQNFSVAKGDFVAEMVIVNINGKYLVDHAMVF